MLVRRSRDIDATQALVRALIHSRLDYCNGVLAHLSIEKCMRLQSVLKAAARLIFQMSERASLTDLIRNKLHWLSFPKQVTYKLCVLSYKCLHGTALDYLSLSISTVPGRTRLTSATVGLLVVPFVPSKTIGSNRSFTYWAPVAWNHLHKLSLGLCDPTVSFATFKKHLKTLLFVNNDVLLNSTR